MNLDRSGSGREACSHFCAGPLITSWVLLHNEMTGKRRGSFAFLSFFPTDATNLVLLPSPPVVLSLYAGKSIDQALQSVFPVLAYFPQRSPSCPDNMTKRVLDRPHTIKHSWKAKSCIAQASMLKNVSKFPSH